MKFDLVGHASMLGANTLWGLMSPVSKLLMASGAVTPFVVTDMRIGGAMVLFWLLSLFLPAEKVSRRDLLKLFCASLFGITLNQGSFIFGVSMTSPGDASIITTSMPLWAMILAALILREPITVKKVSGIVLGASGALLLILGGRVMPGVDVGKAIWGDLLVLFAQLSFAFYLVLYKNFVSKYSLVTIMKWMFTFSFICILPFTAHDLASTGWSGLTAAQIGALAYIVVGATFLSYILMVAGQKRLRPTVAGMYNYVQPIVACMVAVSIGLDTFNMTKLVAICLIFGGVYLVTASRSRADMEKNDKVAAP